LRGKAGVEHAQRYLAGRHVTEPVLTECIGKGFAGRTFNGDARPFERAERGRVVHAPGNRSGRRSLRGHRNHEYR
jgi:hypothetical protein